MNDQQRAAMQMALEALNAMLTHMGMDEDDWNKPTFDQARKAITALREALEVSSGGMESSSGGMAQPQGEDTQCLIYVADVDMPEGFRDHKERIAELEQDPQSKAALDRARDRFAGGGKVIEWVDLTDDEIALAVGSPIDEIYLADFRAVIAKFKEKNTPPVVPQGDPVYYQWRRKNQPWSIRHVYHNKVEATTDDSEVRELYTTPPVVPQGEPVAWVAEDVCKGQFINGKPRRIFWECIEGSGIPLYTTPPSVEAATSDEEMTKFANGYLAGYEDAKEKATKVCDDLYKHDRKESGYDEGWNDALDIAEQAIRSMK